MKKTVLFLLAAAMLLSCLSFYGCGMLDDTEAKELVKSFYDCQRSGDYSDIEPHLSKYLLESAPYAVNPLNAETYVHILESVNKILGEPRDFSYTSFDIDVKNDEGRYEYDINVERNGETVSEHILIGKKGDDYFIADYTPATADLSIMDDFYRAYRNFDKQGITGLLYPKLAAPEEIGDVWSLFNDINQSYGGFIRSGLQYADYHYSYDADFDVVVDYAFVYREEYENGTLEAEYYINADNGDITICGFSYR